MAASVCRECSNCEEDSSDVKRAAAMAIPILDTKEEPIFGPVDLKTGAHVELISTQHVSMDVKCTHVFEVSITSNRTSLCTMHSPRSQLRSFLIRRTNPNRTRRLVQDNDSAWTNVRLSECIEHLIRHTSATLTRPYETDQLPTRSASGPDGKHEES